MGESVTRAALEWIELDCVVTIIHALEWQLYHSKVLLRSVDSKVLATGGAVDNLEAVASNAKAQVAGRSITRPSSEAVHKHASG